MFLGASDNFYPGIDVWWRKRALPEALRGARVCDGAYSGDQLIGLCIGKLTAQVAKLCTLRIEDAQRGRGLAPLLLSRFVEHASARGNSRLHFTMGEQCEFDFGSYFQSLGFAKVAWARGRYRRGHDEHVFSAATRDVRRALIMRCS